jgi:hypothetical protein
MTINTPTGPKPITAGPARCAWIVTAGIVPGEPLPEYTRTWGLTSPEFEGPAGAPAFNAHLVAAQEYARWLMEPRQLNWVRLEWIWY